MSQASPIVIPVVDLEVHVLIVTFSLASPHSKESPQIQADGLCYVDKRRSGLLEFSGFLLPFNIKQLTKTLHYKRDNLEQYTTPVLFHTSAVKTAVKHRGNLEA